MRNRAPAIIRVRDAATAAGWAVAGVNDTHVTLRRDNVRVFVKYDRRGAVVSASSIVQMPEEGRVPVWVLASQADRAGRLIRLLSA